MPTSAGPNSLLRSASVRLRQWAVCHLAVVAREPSLADFFVELVIRINRREIKRSPWTRVEDRRHQEWVELSH